MCQSHMNGKANPLFRLTWINPAPIGLK
jgi:hypothetical protein